MRRKTHFPQVPGDYPTRFTDCDRIMRHKLETLADLMTNRNWHYDEIGFSTFDYAVRLLRTEGVSDKELAERIGTVNAET